MFNQYVESAILERNLLSEMRECDSTNALGRVDETLKNLMNILVEAKGRIEANLNLNNILSKEQRMVVP